MKQFICTMVNLRGAFLLWVGLGVVKHYLFKMLLKTDFLVTLRKYMSYRKLSFPKTDKKMLGTVFLINL